MSSIFEAATLIVYKVPGPGHDTIPKIQFMIRTLYEEDQVNIRGDFQVTRAEGQGAGHITLPLAVHEADHDAWRYLDYLRQKLCEKNLICHWATSLKGDRSRAVSYTVSLTKPASLVLDRCRGMHAPKKRRGQFGDTYDRLYEYDPRLTLQDFRLKIINAALGRLGLQLISEWAHRKDKNDKSKYVGNVTLQSPGEVTTCIETPFHDQIPLDGSLFYVNFHYIFGIITPTTCTTIGLVVVGDGCEIGEHRLQIKEFLAEYNQANNTEATISNIRMSTEYSKYLLCDPCDIITAQGLCENPMPNGRFFRQIFFANADPANYIPDYGKAYDKKSDKAHTARCRSTGRSHPVRTQSTVPLTVEIEPKEAYIKLSPLDELRQERLIHVYNFHKRLEMNDPIHGTRVIDRLHKWNVEIAEKTPPRSEHDWCGVEDRFQEDSDALQTQLRIHVEIDRLDKDYEWAKARLDVVSKILNRFHLKRDLIQARQKVRQLVEGQYDLIVPLNIPGPDGVESEGEELEEEDKRLKVDAMEEAESTVEILEWELEDAKKDDPDYEPPLSATVSDTPSTPLAGFEVVTPSTPPNVYAVVSPVARPKPGKAGIKLKPKLKGVTFAEPTAPEPFVLKRKYEGVPVAAPSAPPSTFRPYLPPTSSAQSHTPSSAEIDKVKGEIYALKRSLKPFSYAPHNLQCAPRDEIKRKIEVLQRKLDGWLGTSGPEQGGSRAGTSSQSPFPSINADIKPKIEPGLETKPVVYGGNRWANLQSRPIINGVDPRRRGMDADKKPEKEEFVDAVRRFKREREAWE